MIISSLCAALLLASNVHAETKFIKFASLAPEGSTWIKVMTEFDQELGKATGGRVRFKMYVGGVAGDEKDVVKKVRIGQLQAAGFTGVGLGLIAPQVRILDAPWLFRNQSEVDFVYKTFAKDLNAAIDKGGYVLLGWTELGFVYVYSRNPINGPEDMKKAKMWVWEGDPIAQAAYDAIGVSPIPLSIVDVMSSLQNGLIDAVYGPPLGVLALQWFTRTKYIYSVPMADSAGAVLLSKKAFSELAPEDQKTLLDLGAKHLRRFNELTRAENDKALDTLTKQGLILSAKATAQTLQTYEELGRKARRELAGKLYSQDLLDRVEKALEQYRLGKAKKG